MAAGAEEGEVGGAFGVPRGPGHPVHGGVTHPVVQLTHHIGALGEDGGEHERGAHAVEDGAEEERQAGAQGAPSHPDLPVGGVGPVGAGPSWLCSG